jgi:hypothetical protein
MRGVEHRRHEFRPFSFRKSIASLLRWVRVSLGIKRFDSESSNSKQQKKKQQQQQGEDQEGSESGTGMMAEVSCAVPCPTGATQANGGIGATQANGRIGATQANGGIGATQANGGTGAMPSGTIDDGSVVEQLSEDHKDDAAAAATPSETGNNNDNNDGNAGDDDGSGDGDDGDVDDDEEESDEYPGWLRVAKTGVFLPVLLFVMTMLFFLVFFIFAFEMYLIFKWGGCQATNYDLAEEIRNTTEGLDASVGDYTLMLLIPHGKICTSATLKYGIIGWLAELVPGTDCSMRASAASQSVCQSVSQRPHALLLTCGW